MENVQLAARGMNIRTRMDASLKVGITFIGTAKYATFFEGYYKAVKENFLPNDDRTFFVFSSSSKVHNKMGFGGRGTRFLSTLNRRQAG